MVVRGPLTTPPSRLTNEAVSREVERARQNHLMFYGYQTPEEYWSVPLHWPMPQSIAGKAVAIGYTSDKFDEPGDWKDYHHDHEKPFPTVVTEQTPEFKKNKTPWYPDDPPVWTYLGFALDLQFDRGRGPETFDWTQLDADELPFLCWVEHRKMLIIQDQKSEFPAILLSSPILTVTAHGIEH